MAVQDYELLLRVRADLVEATNGLKGLTDQLGTGDAATQKLGESADQATDRIRAMVQASKEQAAAQERVAESMRSINERAASPGTAPAGSGPDVGVDAAAFNAAVIAKQEALRLLNAAMAGNIATTEGAAAAEVALDGAMAAGAITAREQGAYIQALDAAKAKDVVVTEAATAATVENTAALAINGGVAREVGVLIGELARGNTARLEGSLITLSNRTGLLTLLFNPLTLAIGAVVAAMGAFVVAANQAASDQNKFNNALAKTGGYAGTTASSMEHLSQQIAGSNARLGEAREIITSLAATGKVGEQALASMGQAAMDMAELTGVSADKAASAVMGMFDGTTASLLKANDQYHFLTTAIYDQIKALEDEGDTQAAMDVAAQAFHDAAAQRIEEEKEQVRGLARVWDSVKESIQGAWQETKTAASIIVGTADDQTRLYELLGRKARAQESVDDHGRYNFGQTMRNMVGLGYSPDDDAEIQRLQEKIKKDTEAAELKGLNEKLTAGAVNADAELDKLGQSLDKNAAKQAALNKLNADFLAIWKGNDPDRPDKRLTGVQAITGDDGSTTFSGGLYDKLQADIEKRYAEKGPRAKRQKSDAGAVEAGQQLIKMLNDEQGALDPTVKVWAQYNDKVAEANKLADKAKTARGADVQAIDAQRDAVIATAAAMRDAALDKIIDKDRQAWEKLRDSLRTPLEVKTDKAEAQLQQLETLMQKLKGTKDEISQADYNDALQRIGQQSITKAPKYKDPTKSASAFGGLGATAGLGGSGNGVGSALGNMGKAFEGLAKNFEAKDALETWYADQLAAIAKDRDKDLQHHQLYLAQKAELDKQYAEQSKAIDNARYNLGLSTASNFFGGLAQLQHSKNAQMARVGKAAAIAQATINTYQAATGAYSAMASIPYVGPILGAIAAAAAIVAGLANVAQIRSQPVGFSDGGYTGPGGKHQVAGVVHAGEVVFSQQDVARLGGVNAVESLRLGGVPGFADGGYVPALPNVPEQPGLSSQIAAAAAARNASPAAGGPDPGQTHIHVWSMEEAAQRLANVPSFQKAVVHIVGDNPRTIQGKWGK
jgi:phage-related minor tail protein